MKLNCELKEFSLSQKEVVVVQISFIGEKQFQIRLN